MPSAQHILKQLWSSNTPNYFPEEHKKNIKINIFTHTATQKGLEKNCPVHQQKYFYYRIVMPHIHKIPSFLHIEAVISYLHQCKCCDDKDHNEKFGRNADWMNFTAFHVMTRFPRNVKSSKTVGMELDDHTGFYVVWGP